MVVGQALGRAAALAYLVEATVASAAPKGTTLVDAPAIWHPEGILALDGAVSQRNPALDLARQVMDNAEARLPISPRRGGIGNAFTVGPPTGKGILCVVADLSLLAAAGVHLDQFFEIGCSIAIDDKPVAIRTELGLAEALSQHVATAPVNIADIQLVLEMVRVPHGKGDLARQCCRFGRCCGSG